MYWIRDTQLFQGIGECGWGATSKPGGIRGDHATSFFLPVAHDGIDWQRAPEFLDKELDRITREAQAKNRRVDLLVKVWLLNGDELLVLIHAEIQGDRDPEFAERMYACQ